MISTSDIEEINSILKEYANCTLTVEKYTFSHRNIRIKLTKNNTCQVIKILSTGCRKFSGKFTYDNAYLHIIKHEDVYILKDKYTDFKYITDGEFYLDKGTKIEFVTQLYTWAKATRMD